MAAPPAAGLMVMTMLLLQGSGDAGRCGSTKKRAMGTLEGIYSLVDVVRRPLRARQLTPSWARGGDQRPGRAACRSWGPAWQTGCGQVQAAPRAWSLGIQVLQQTSDGGLPRQQARAPRWDQAPSSADPNAARAWSCWPLAKRVVAAPPASVASGHSLPDRDREQLAPRFGPAGKRALQAARGRRAALLCKRRAAAEGASGQCQDHRVAAGSQGCSPARSTAR